MKGYSLILGAEVTDQEAQKEYGALWAPLAQQYEARLINNSDAVKLVEARDAFRVLLVEFPSFAAAQACYDDPRLPNGLALFALSGVEAQPRGAQGRNWLISASEGTAQKIEWSTGTIGCLR